MEPRRSVGQQGLRVLQGEKKPLEKKKPEHNERELEDLQGKIWTDFIHLK